MLDFRFETKIFDINYINCGLNNCKVNIPE